MSRFIYALILGLATLLITACGGGGGSSSPTPIDPNKIGLGFNKASGISGAVTTVALANDSSDDVYVGGSFVSYGSTTASHIARFNNDGSLDEGFITGTGFDQNVNSIVAVNDGSGDIYVGGDFTQYNGVAVSRIVRLKQNGSLVSPLLFAASVNGSVYSIAKAPGTSGDIYVGGGFGGRILRLNSDGSQDADFVVGSGFSNIVFSIAVAPDGSVYAGGMFTSYKSTNIARIARLSSTGGLDAGFVVPADGFNSNVRSIALNAAGDLYVGGEFTRYGAATSNRLARLKADGSLDTGFNIGTGPDRTVRGVAMAADGSENVYIAGQFLRYNGSTSRYVARITANGTPASGFMSGSGFDDISYSLAAMTDGSVYIGGSFIKYKGNKSRHLSRVGSDGGWDDSFVLESDSGFNDRTLSTALALDGSGDVYVGGYFTGYNDSFIQRAARLNNDGSKDDGFATGSGFSSTVESIAASLDNSGDIYVGGIFSSYDGTNIRGLARLKSDGSLDPDFDIGNGFNTTVLTIAPATDNSGDVYVGGNYTSFDGQNQKYIVRLNSNGSRDADFNVGTGFNSYVTSIVPSTDGTDDIYVAGQFTAYNGTTGINYLAKLDNKGALVAGFDAGTGFNTIVNSIVLANDKSGDIYVGGNFISYNGSVANRIVRINSVGLIVPGFVVGAGFDSHVNAIAAATDGSGDIYAGGTFTSYSGDVINRVIRLNSDGTHDTDFNSGTGFDHTVHSISAATDGSGDVFVAGFFGSYQNTTVDSIVRLNADGSLN